MPIDDRNLKPGMKLVGRYHKQTYTCKVIEVEGKLKFTGRVGREVSIDEANECARIAVLNCLAAIRNVVGSLDKIKRIVRITGYVRGGEDFNDHPRVLNGASDLLVEIFGDAGVHTRSAVGSSGLPLGAPVEVEMIVEIVP